MLTANYLVCKIGWSTTQIGRFYNGRDHSTVCYGIQRIESLRESNPDMDPLLVELSTSSGKIVPKPKTAMRGAMKIQKNA